MAVLAHEPSSTKRPEQDLDLERRAFLDLLRMANTLSEPKEIAQQLVVLARHLSSCEAVAIRLKVGARLSLRGQPGLPCAVRGPRG